jgi:hypothetical protein
MLGVKEIPLDLRNYLDDIEMYANLQDGSIASRQIVSLALVFYSRLQRLEKNVQTLDWNGLIEKEKNKNE